MVKSLVIADNHPLFRTGIRQIVEDSGLFEVIAEVGDGESCVFQVQSLTPDCVLLDLGMPKKSGFEVAKILRQTNPDCRIVIVSMHSSSEFVEQARSLGCCGFVAKEDASHELISVLAHEGTNFLMSSSAGSGEEGFPSGPNTLAEGLIAGLTRTEIRVLEGIAQSKTSGAIASEMNLSERTVHTHRQNISKKLGLQGANSLIQFAIENRQSIRKG